MPYRLSPRNSLLGCGFILMALSIILVGSLLLLLQNERNRASYPGAKAIKGQNFTSLNLERQFLRFENAYVSRDSLVAIRKWYSESFAISSYRSRTEDGETCVFLRQSVRDKPINRRVLITICDTASGRSIYVTSLFSRH